MECEAFLAAIDRYIDRELGRALVPLFREHGRSCASCREQLLAAVALRTRLQLDYAQAQSQGLRRKLARPPSVFVSRE